MASKKKPAKTDDYFERNARALLKGLNPKALPHPTHIAMIATMFRKVAKDGAKMSAHNIAERGPLWEFDPFPTADVINPGVRLGVLVRDGMQRLMVLNIESVEVTRGEWQWGDYDDETGDFVELTEEVKAWMILDKMKMVETDAPEGTAPPPEGDSTLTFDDVMVNLKESADEAKAKGDNGPQAE